MECILVPRGYFLPPSILWKLHTFREISHPKNISMSCKICNFLSRTCSLFYNLLPSFQAVGHLPTPPYKVVAAINGVIFNLSSHSSSSGLFIFLPEGVSLSLRPCKTVKCSLDPKSCFVNVPQFYFYISF